MEKLTINMGTSTIVFENNSVTDERKLLENIDILKENWRNAIKKVDSLELEKVDLIKELKQYSNWLNEKKKENELNNISIHILSAMRDEIGESISKHLHPDGFFTEDLVDIVCNCIESHTKLNDELKELKIANEQLEQQKKSQEFLLSPACVQHVNHPVDYSRPTAESKPSEKETAPKGYHKPLNPKKCINCGVEFMPDHNRTMKCNKCRGIVVTMIPETEVGVMPLPKTKKGAFIIDPIAE